MAYAVEFYGSGAENGCDWGSVDPADCACCEDRFTYDGATPCDTPVPGSSFDCIYDNSSCSPDCHEDDWEGAQMWLAVPFNKGTYSNLIVKYDLETSGLSLTRHGFNKSNDDDPFRFAGVFPGGLANLYRPYHWCKDRRLSLDCADCRNHEETLSVLFTTTNIMPLLGSTENIPSRLENIRQWEVAEVLPWRVLKEYGASKSRYLNLSMLDGTDRATTLNLWFRAQLNSSDSGNVDTIKIDNIQIWGQKGYAPTALPAYTPYPTPTPTWTGQPTATPTRTWGATCTPTDTPSS